MGGQSKPAPQLRGGQLCKGSSWDLGMTQLNLSPCHSGGDKQSKRRHIEGECWNWTDGVGQTAVVRC